MSVLADAFIVVLIHSMPLSVLFTILLSATDATPLSVIIAGLAFLNTLGIFGLIFHVGQYVGKNDIKWIETEKRLQALDATLSTLHAQEISQIRTDAILTGLRTVIETEMKVEIQLLRKRSHELANIMLRFTLGDKQSLPWLKDLEKDQE